MRPGRLQLRGDCGLGVEATSCLWQGKKLVCDFSWKTSPFFGRWPGCSRSSELRRAASSFDHLGERGSWGETHYGYRAAEDLLRLFFDTKRFWIK